MREIRFDRWIPTWVIGGLLFALAQGAYAYCTSDDVCPFGQFCVDGQCSDSPPPPPPPPPACIDGICATPVVCNECSHWVDDHDDHTDPLERIHAGELGPLYPMRPDGGAAPEHDYDVTIFWRSYHRAMNQGTDGGHCGRFCKVVDRPIDQCDSFAGLDGLGLRPEKTVRHGGAVAESISIARIDGPFQNDEGKWEWAERRRQNGAWPFNEHPCSQSIVGGSHEWTSRPTDILQARFRVDGWDGVSWNGNPDYELFWDEGDGFANGNDDFEFRVTPNQPGVVALGRAVEACLKHGTEGQRFTLHRDAVLMLCENNARCHDHLFEIWFDVQCTWNAPVTCLSTNEVCESAGDCCSGVCDPIPDFNMSVCQ